MLFFLNCLLVAASRRGENPNQNPSKSHTNGSGSKKSEDSMEKMRRDATEELRKVIMAEIRESRANGDHQRAEQLERDFNLK